MIGKPENARFLHLSLFQGTANKPKAAITMEMKASENPTLTGIKFDPTLFCTAFKKNRFYLFTKRGPDDLGWVKHSLITVKFNINSEICDWVKNLNLV